VDGIVAQLEHSDRIYEINLECLPTLQIEDLWTAMQVPFPELLFLNLTMGRLSYGPVLPDPFLGGSAPHLRHLSLTSIPFPGLPKFLLSANHLVKLFLENIPHSGYFSPEATATGLSMLTSLEKLHIGFASPESCPDPEIRHPPPLTRSALPALTKFLFKGVYEYLEKLLALIDAPRLHELSTTFFNDIDYNIPELIRFVNRLSTFKAPNEAHIFFDALTASVKLQPQTSNNLSFQVGISSGAPIRQLVSLAQICTTFLPLFSTMENLFISEARYAQFCWEDGIENIEWLELFLPFMAVKDLYLSKKFAPRIALTLQKLTGGRTTQVLPTLENLFLEGFQPSEPVHEGIGQFISARQLTNRPVAISVWERFN
jgi:hypothetical protein